MGLWKRVSRVFSFLKHRKREPCQLRIISIRYKVGKLRGHTLTWLVMIRSLMLVLIFIKMKTPEIVTYIQPHETRQPHMCKS